MKSIKLFAILSLLIATAASAQDRKFIISGSVGVPGVAMKGLPGDVITDEQGHYSAAVPSGFSGMVRPEKEGFSFEPASRRYDGVNETLNDNYIANPITFAIAGNAGAPNVAMHVLPGNTVVETDRNGNYSVQVPYYWSGKVTPVLAGYMFTPESRTYQRLVTDRLKQDYTIGQWTESREGQTWFPQRGLAPITRASTAPDVLIVPTTQVDASQFAQTAEDMRVMLQILREKTIESRSGANRSVLPDYGPIFGSGGRGAQAIYIQRHAVVFALEVDFPLGSSTEANAGPKPERGGDPVWQKARERLADSGRTGSSDETNPFNFDQFKENMIRALRHAANLRHLDPNELVVISVSGGNRPVSSSEGGSLSMQGEGYMQGGGSFNSSGGGGYMNSSSYSSFSGGSSRGATAGPRTSGISTPGSVMTIQARKADVDAFAKDQISFERFNQKVKVFNH
jgi:hypothetical protein